MTDGPLKRILKLGVRLVEWLSLPVLFLSAWYLKFLRQIGLWRLPFSRNFLTRMGVFPLRDHYYDPFINPRKMNIPLDADRSLPGLDLNVTGQLELLSKLHFEKELAPLTQHVYEAEMAAYGPNKFYFGGDADFYYSMIRLIRPKRIVEIGSGFSTLVARSAVDKNREESSSYGCEITCIEPYSNAWLEKLGVRVIRSKVEDVDFDLFTSLEAGDILFIDSSHVIRPQGDVLFEYLEVLPRLRPGVLIHIHDIFTPKNYPDAWILLDRRQFNEQYLVEAFLNGNSTYRVIAALHYLYHDHFEALSKHLPHVERLPASLRHRAPTSLWLERSAN
jgi:predicted O-methyltransferase YrrM